MHYVLTLTLTLTVLHTQQGEQGSGKWVGNPSKSLEAEAWRTATTVKYKEKKEPELFHLAALEGP